MRFEWNDDTVIGYYEVTLVYDNGVKLAEMSFTDYTSEFHKDFDKRKGFKRPYSFETHYCCGWSNSYGFDYDKEYNNHVDENGNRIGGYQGKCTHTVDDVKKWCEEYLASLYIINYEEELSKLELKKKTSDWFLNNGYTGEYEGKRQR